VLCQTALDLAQTMADLIGPTDTFDELEVVLAGNPGKPGNSDLVRALASHLVDMGYTVFYDDTDPDQTAGCDLYVATDADTRDQPDRTYFVVLDDQPGDHKITVGEFVLVMSTAAVCRRHWHWQHY
jgi:hypothetical protein